MNEDNFKWTDELVAEYGEYYRKKQGVDYGTWGKCILDSFKKSKEKDIPKYWQIISFIHTEDKRERFILEGSGLYKGNVWNSIHNLNEMLHEGSCVDNGKVIIESVKRLSDGEVFTVGDKIQTGNGELSKIISFKILEGITMAVEIENGYYRLLSKIDNVKSKVPLFTTADLKEVYEFDTYPIYKVDKSFNILRFAGCDACPYENESMYFYHEEKAEEYIFKNKSAQISYKEIEQFLIKNYYTEIDFHDLLLFFKSKINI